MIEQNITAINAVPLRSEATDETAYRKDVEAFLGKLKLLSEEFRIAIPQFNSTATTINEKEASATASAATATTKAGVATTKANEASASAASALALKEAAEAIFDNFDDKYLGPKATAPTVDNDGNPLTTGALYYKTTAPKGIYVYDAELAGWFIFSYIPTSHGTLSGKDDADAHPISSITGLEEAISSLGVSGVRQTVTYASTDQTTGLPNFLSVSSVDVSNIHDVQGDNSTVATYPLNGNANDLGGNYNATASGITYDTGKFGQCAVFNGNAYITKPLTYKSYSLWFQASSLADSVILDSRDDNGDVSYGLQLSSTKIVSSASALYINGVLTSSGTYTPPLNEWIHVVCSSSVESTAMTLGMRYSLDSVKFTGKIGQVRLFNKALSAAEAVMYFTETKPVAGLNIGVLATTKTIEFNCAGGASDKKGEITTDRTITGLSPSAINYLYADINETSGAVTLGSTTIAPEYQQGLPSTFFPTLDTVNKGSGVVLSNGNLTATKTVVTSWANSNVYASKLVKSGKFYAEVAVGSVASTDFLHIGVSTINTEQTQQFSYNTAGYSYLNNGNKVNSASSVAYGASYTTGDKIGVLYDVTTGQLTFYKNGVSQGVAFTLPAYTPVYLAVSQYSTGNVTVNYGASAFAYPIPSGAVAWNAERIAGRHIFDISAMEMWITNGTAYDKKYRVFLAEATTDATSVTSVINYALNGKYESQQSAITMGQTTNYAHNLGCRPKSIKLKLECAATNLGYAVGDVIEPSSANYADSSGYTLANTSRNNATLTLASSYLYVINKTSFAVNGLTPTNWRKFIEVDRGW